MKLHRKAGWRLTAILLASAVAVFGQAYNAPGSQMQAPDTSAARSAQLPPPEVGPGLISYVEGQAWIDGKALTSRSAQSTALNPGQVLNTQNGFVELLFTPDAYLRVGHNSELRMIANGLTDTQAQLVRGNAMLEVDHLVNGANLVVQMNGATARVEKRGLYDFNMDQQAIKVLDGKLTVTESDGSTTLSRGHEVLLASAQPLKSRGFDQKAVRNGALFAWSKARSQQLTEAERPQQYAAGGWYAPGWYWGGPYWSYSFGFGYPYAPWGWGWSSPFYYGGYYVPYYRSYYVYPINPGHHHGGISHQGLSNRVHQLFSGKSHKGH